MTTEELQEILDKWHMGEWRTCTIPDLLTEVERLRVDCERMAKLGRAVNHDDGFDLCGLRVDC